MRKQAETFIVASLLSIYAARAHCPLCVIGAASAAGGAAYVGVNNAVIGVFIGAFAVSMGWWIGRAIKKQFIPFQIPIFIVISFVTTVLPLMPLLSDVRALYLSWLGTYGVTFAINLFLVGSLIGGIIMSLTPQMSKRITALRNGKMIPYQGILLTLTLLVIAGLIMQMVL